MAVSTNGNGHEEADPTALRYAEPRPADEVIEQFPDARLDVAQIMIVKGGALPLARANDV